MGWVIITNIKTGKSETLGDTPKPDNRQSISANGIPYNNDSYGDEIIIGDK